MPPHICRQAPDKNPGAFGFVTLGEDDAPLPAVSPFRLLSDLHLFQVSVTARSLDRRVVTPDLAGW